MVVAIKRDDAAAPIRPDINDEFGLRGDEGDGAGEVCGAAVAGNAGVRSIGTPVLREGGIGVGGMREGGEKQNAEESDEEEAARSIPMGVMHVRRG